MQVSVICRIHLTLSLEKRHCDLPVMSWQLSAGISLFFFKQHLNISYLIIDIHFWVHQSFNRVLLWKWEFRYKKRMKKNLTSGLPVATAGSRCLNKELSCCLSCLLFLVGCSKIAWKLTGRPYLTNSIAIAMSFMFIHLYLWFI